MLQITRSRKCKKKTKQIKYDYARIIYIMLFFTLHKDG